MLLENLLIFSHRKELYLNKINCVFYSFSMSCTSNATDIHVNGRKSYLNPK